MNIGCHLSIAGGLRGLGQAALRVGANTMQFFVRNPRGGTARNFDELEIIQFIKFLEKHEFAKLVVHAPYTLNLCAKDSKIREISERTMMEDIKILNKIPGNYYNFHPGFHVGLGTDLGINLVIESLKKIVKIASNTTILLETMSGKGTEVGFRFDELARIINGVENYNLCVCLDTCHVFAAGYDIVNDLDGVLDEFDKTIGREKLRAVHLNDSAMPFGSHKDRHACIGAGMIGKDAIIRIINHQLLKNLPFILETPNDEFGYADEIRFLRKSWRE